MSPIYTTGKCHDLCFFSCFSLTMYSLLALLSLPICFPLLSQVLYFYVWFFVLHWFVPLSFRSTSQSKAVHGSHQGSSSSCARWRDHGIMRRHCILRCIAVHLFGIVWASRLIYKDTMYRSFTPELFWSITSIVVLHFSWTCLFRQPTYCCWQHAMLKFESEVGL